MAPIQVVVICLWQKALSKFAFPIPTARIFPHRLFLKFYGKQVFLWTSGSVCKLQAPTETPR